jgi:predicted membrane protein
MKIIGRAISFLFAASILAGIASAIAAVAMKQRLPRVEDPEADEVHLVAVFEPIAFASRAASFRGGTLDTWYGGGVVDLRDAVPDPAGAVLQVRAVFGGVQLVVPETWRVTIGMTSIFGGVGDTRSSDERPADAPRLILEGVAVFGGVGITSSVSEKQMEELGRAVAEERAAAAAAVDTSF